MNTSPYFVAKKTFELDDRQKKTICYLYEKTLGLKLDITGFVKKYQVNEIGYSYHGLMIMDGKIVGSCTIIPRKYNVFGSQKIIGLAVDSMIAKEHRRIDLFALKKMLDVSLELMRADNINFIFAIPNPNAYQYWKEIDKWIDIGELDFFILPINIGKIVYSLKYFNIFSRTFSYFCNLIVCNKDFETTENKVQKIFLIKDELFKKHRYDNTYKNLSFHNNPSFIYKIYNENGIKTAYIIDLVPLSKKSLEYAVKTIYLEQRNNIDAIMYIGNIDFTPKNMFRVPEKFKPRKVFVAGKFTNDDIDYRMLNLNNWFLNLADFDVR